MMYVLVIILILLFIAFSIMAIALALGGGLFIGIFPATFFAIRNYITSVRDNVSNKPVLVVIHIAFYILLLAILAVIVFFLLRLFGIDLLALVM